MRALTTFDTFQQELAGKEDEITRLLPPTLDLRFFMACTVTAVKGNADLLSCDRRSLSIAITRAAQDGLPPDGRLAVIVPVKDNSAGVLRATYIPMYQGIIQRAYELGDIAIRAKIVCEHDVFDYDEGDVERLVHKRAFLKPRGAMMAAYAIFTRGDRITHREVMSIPDIEKVRSVSRAKNGPWVTWYEEMAKKTVIRKGSKQVAFASNDMGSALRRIVERDDDMADLDQTPTLTSALTMPLAGPGLSAQPAIDGADVRRTLSPEPAAFAQRGPAAFTARAAARSVLEEGFGPLPDDARDAANDALTRRIT